MFAINLNREDCDGFLVKREVLDMMNIADPALISLPATPGDVGLGATFTFPYETIEALLPLDDEHLLILNDNNYPFSANRNPASADYNEAVVVRVKDLNRNHCE